MVTVVNEGPCNDSQYKRQLENDCHFSESMPKYKLRKVSVARDFPLGCGPNVQVVNLRPEEMKLDGGSLGVTFRDGLDTNAVDIQKEMNEAEDCRREVSATREFPPLCGTNAPQEFKDSAEACTRRASAIRDIPPPCRTNPSQDFKDVCPRIISGNMSSIEVENVEVKCEVIETLNYGMETGLLGQPSLCDVENGTLGETLTSMESIISTETLIAGAEESGGLRGGEFEKGESKELDPEKMEESDTLISKCGEDTREVAGKETVLYPKDKRKQSRPLENVLGTGGPVAREIVYGLMAASYCPWGQGKSALTSSVGRTTESKVNEDDVGWKKQSKVVAKKSSGRSSTKKKSFYLGKAVVESLAPMIVKDEGEYGALNAEPCGASPFPSPRPPIHEKCNFHVSLPPFGPNSSSHGDARNRVRETLRLFTSICRKLLQEKEAKSGPEEERRPRQSEKRNKRIDLQAVEIIKNLQKEVNKGMHHIGAVPGVEVGDEFQYRVELAIVGIHRLYQGGIDYLSRDGLLLATSIVASGAYSDDIENADVLIYSGQGGNIVGKKKQPEDQKLEGGNLALKNSIAEKIPVRVIRGSKEIKTSDSSDAKDKIVMTYVYDGLYTVERYWSEIGKHGKMVFMFELSRIPGQPEIAWKVMKSSKKSRIREGVCVDDISGGNESFPVCAVNTIDSENPPTFTYTAKMIYPDWFNLIPPKGCDCTGRCSDSRKCLCAVKNGGEIPYNYNGAIVEAKPVVYECGPSCKCPPSCYNRVSQRGTKIKLEIFKTELRGWGVRSLSFIPSGSFICEYAGELLEDKEAEQRAGNDEYLFDIGQNSDNCSNKHDVELVSSEVTEEGGFTIDAAQFGNIGRFINHSCSPNLYAQNVVYDHEDTRIPHIMLFAAENIPALQELTYHYNYSVDQVRDSNGNIKVKSCYCGSADCTGRMY